MWNKISHFKIDILEKVKLTEIPRLLVNYIQGVHIVFIKLQTKPPLR